MADVADENPDDQPTSDTSEGSSSTPAEGKPTPAEGKKAESGSARKSGSDAGQKPLAGLMIAYTVGRLGVFIALAALFWLVGFKGLPGLLAAAIVSIPLSFVLLKTWRVEVARRIEERKTAQLSMKDEFRITRRD